MTNKTEPPRKCRTCGVELMDCVMTNECDFCFDKRTAPRPEPPRETCPKCKSPIKGMTRDPFVRDVTTFVPMGPYVKCAHPWHDAPARETPPQRITDIEHLAYSILHGTFNPDSPGGCSCGLCRAIREKMDELCKEEAARFYAEYYPPPGGLL